MIISVSHCSLLQNVIQYIKMSKPRPICWKEGTLLILLGALSLFSLQGVIDRGYTEPQFNISRACLIGALMIYPTCLLGFIRKAIAKKHGDWQIMIFVLGVTLSLFLLL